MEDPLQLQELRAAQYQRDGPAAVAAIERTGLVASRPQLVGDALVIAVAQQVEGAADLAADFVQALRERDWDGDEDLAEHLESARGRGPATMLHPLPVDLEELADILEGDPTYSGGRIELTTGEVWHASTIEYAQETGELDEEDLEDPDRWLWVESQGSSEGYRDIQMFIETVADPGSADRLAIAIEGRGAFRRFKDVLARWPDERDRWYAFSDDRRRGRARAWLAQAGYRPSTPARQD